MFLSVVHVVLSMSLCRSILHVDGRHGLCRTGRGAIRRRGGRGGGWEVLNSRSFAAVVQTVLGRPDQPVSELSSLVFPRTLSSEVVCLIVID